MQIFCMPKAGGMYSNHWALRVFNRAVELAVILVVSGFSFNCRRF
jgi:hypothetical protein